MSRINCCFERVKEEWTERREQIRQSREETSCICRNMPWPLSLVCDIVVNIIYFIIEVITFILLIIRWMECVIVPGHRIIGYNDNCGMDAGGKITSKWNRNQYSIAFMNSLVNNRFDYDDSGKRCEFRIKDGIVQFKTQSNDWKNIGIGNDNNPSPIAISFMNKRCGELTQAPVFDMLAANGSRILVKEKDKPSFYFTTLDEEFLHAKTKDITIAGKEIKVPGFYIKLDPEYNQPNANDSELIWMNARDYGYHPSVTFYEYLNWIKCLPNRDMMIIKVQPKIWHLLDTRPPNNSGLLLPWIETYDHIWYADRLFGICDKRSQKSIKIYEVLNLAVGNMHWHIHYEDTQGGEMYNGPFDIIHGPVADSGGYCDGTCNFYILCKVKIDPLKGNNPTKTSFAILWIDEQTFGSERWRLLHPADNDWNSLRNWSLAGGFFTGIHGRAEQSSYSPAGENPA